MTSDQQIALASVIVAGVAISGTILNSFLDRRACAKEARTARSQDRLERTYLELLGYTHRRIEQPNAIRPLVTDKGAPEPVVTTPEEIARVRSLVSAIATVDVRKILDEFGAVLQRIASADQALTGIAEEERQTGRPAQPATWGGTATDFHLRLQADKQQLTAIEDRLHEQVRRDLVR